MYRPNVKSKDLLPMAMVLFIMFSIWNQATASEEKTKKKDESQKIEITLNGKLFIRYNDNQEWKKLIDTPGSTLVSPSAILKLVSSDFSDVVVANYLNELKQTNLQALDLTMSTITDAAIDNINKLQNIKSIVLPSRITDVGLKKLALKSLTQITFFYSQVTDSGLLHLLSFKKLNSVSLISCWNITDKGLSNIAKVKKLIRLEIVRCEKITDEGIKHIRQHNELQYLVLSCSENITDNGLKNIEGLTNLVWLDVHSLFSITDSSLAYVGKLKKLKHLDLCNTYIGDRGLSYISSLENISTLNLSRCDNISDKGISNLKNMKNMEELNLGTCINLTDTAISYLKDLKKIKSLELGGCYKITDKGLAQLSSLENIEMLGLGACKNITCQGLKELGKLKKLKYRHCSKEVGFMSSCFGQRGRFL